MIRSAPQYRQMSAGSPHNKRTGARRYVPTPKLCDSLTELKGNSNTFTNNFTARNVLLWIWMHSSFHGYTPARRKVQVSLPRTRSHIGTSSRTAYFELATAASLPGSPVWPGTYEKTTNSRALWRWNICQNLNNDWLDAYSGRPWNALREPSE